MMCQVLFSELYNLINSPVEQVLFYHHLTHEEAEAQKNYQDDTHR